MISLSLPRSRKTWGWSNGGLAPTHMNSCEPISITETPASLWKCGTTWSDIMFTLNGSDGRPQSTMRAWLSLAVASMGASAAVGAALWPHAREAAAILVARDEPAQLADIGVNSALRNNPALIEENIEAALAAHDADLANSFVELAREKNLALGDALKTRVSDAVAEGKSAA